MILLIITSILLKINVETHQMNTSPVGKKQLLKYTSDANDLADIMLVFWEKGSFEITFRTLAENESFKFKGKWKQDEQHFKLVFGRKKPDVYALFENAGRVEIMDEKTVQFRKYEQGIWIWGIYCSLEKMPG